MPLTIAYYSFDDPAYACARLRILEPARALGGAVRLLAGAVPRGPGHAVATDILDAADLILIQRYFPCPQTAPILEAVFASGKPVVYDTDDDWTAIGPEHPFAARMGDILPHILETVRRATLVTVATAVLATVFRPYNPRVRVVPNLLPGALWQPTAPPRRPVAAIGLAATATHQADMAPLETALTRLARTLGDTARFVFFGCPPSPAHFPGATVIPFAPEYAAYAARLPRLGLSIGLAPLCDTPFNRAKSPIKWMEYAVSGMAGVFADLPPYREVVVPGETGLLVGPEPEAWAEAVAGLVANDGLRRRLAANAQAAVIAGHTLPSGSGRYHEAWTQAARGNAPAP